jgi:hypothetical protein
MVSCGCCHACTGSVLMNEPDKPEIAKLGIEVLVNENIRLDEIISDM